MSGRQAWVAVQLSTGAVVNAVLLWLARIYIHSVYGNFGWRITEYMVYILGAVQEASNYFFLTVMCILWASGPK